jgi:hypothetical protein
LGTIQSNASRRRRKISCTIFHRCSCSALSRRSGLVLLERFTLQWLPPAGLTGQTPRCFAMKPNFTSTPSRSRPRLFQQISLHLELGDLFAQPCYLGILDAATYFFQWQVTEDLPLICHQPLHKQEQRVCNPLFCKEIRGRGERIRTSGLYVPNVALYRAKLHPDGRTIAKAGTGKP